MYGSFLEMSLFYVAEPRDWEQKGTARPRTQSRNMCDKNMPDSVLKMV